MNVLRHLICILLSLMIFVACNQSRHIISDRARAEDKAYAKAHQEKIKTLCQTAKKLIGKPYQLGSSGPRAFDCSGLAIKLFKSIDLALPRKSLDQAHVGQPIEMRLVRPGDLLFFGYKRVDHVAVVTKVKSDKIYVVHATTSNGVVEQVLQESDYWMKRLKQARRVII